MAAHPAPGGVGLSLSVRLWTPRCWPQVLAAYPSTIRRRVLRYLYLDVLLESQVGKGGVGWGGGAEGGGRQLRGLWRAGEWAG